jgi:membrane protein
MSDRGTHLAAMIAYFALLAFVPLLFLALALIGLAGEPTERSYLVEQLGRMFPQVSLERILEVVAEVQESSGALGVIGGIALIWAALGFLSVLESALNIVYGRPNRTFFHQKAYVLLLTGGGLVILFGALVLGSLAREAGGYGGVLAYVYGILISTGLVFVFAWSIYTLLTNERLRWRQTLPGAVFAALVLQASFQLLPVFVRATSGFVALQAFGGLALLLFWIYLMANVLVFGAELNWWLDRGRVAADEQPVGLA